MASLFKCEPLSKWLSPNMGGISSCSASISAAFPLPYQCFVAQLTKWNLFIILKTSPFIDTEKKKQKKKPQTLTHPLILWKGVYFFKCNSAYLTLFWKLIKWCLAFIVLTMGRKLIHNYYKCLIRTNRDKSTVSRSIIPSLSGVLVHLTRLIYSSHV